MPITWVVNDHLRQVTATCSVHCWFTGAAVTVTPLAESHEGEKQILPRGRATAPDGRRGRRDAGRNAPGGGHGWPGESPIKHVIEIMIENHTFDDLFGSCPGSLACLP